MIDIDGSYGEGGGAILRQALALSVYLGEALRVFNIRSGRTKPGLAAQHLKAVEVAGALSGARVRGAGLGSKEVTFDPGPAQAGSFQLDIGTAGSATLVLQTILLPCLTQPGEYTFEVTGGTDVPWSPPWDYLAQVTLPVLRPFGAAQLKLIRRGYYPKGAGQIAAKLNGSSQPKSPQEWLIQGDIRAIRGVSHAAGLLRERRVAERQAGAAEHLLARLGCPVEIEVAYSESAGLGSGVTLWTESLGSPPLGFSALGAKGKASEDVGREAARALMTEMESGAAVDRHLADQLIPFLAVVGGSLRTSAITAHVRSSIYVAERILGTRFDVHGLTVSAHPEGGSARKPTSPA